MSIGTPTKRMNGIADAWIVRGTNARSARFRVFCFHCAGGSAGQFRGWDTLAPRDVEFVGVQLPGREHRMAERPIGSFPELTGALMDALLQHLDQPYALFGHSLGALTAFEVARVLRASQTPQPRCLVVAARAAPQLASGHAPVDELPAQRLIEVLQRYGGLSEDLLRDAALMRDLLPTIRADFRLARHYVYEEQRPLPYPIRALGGESDVSCPEADLRAWADQTCHSFECRVFSGGHFFLRQHAAAIVELLSRAPGPARERTPA